MNHGYPPGYGPGMQAAPSSQAQPLYTMTFRCKTCGKALGHCAGVTHGQLQAAASQASRSFGCSEPGHVINANLAYDVVPYQAPQPALPPMVAAPVSAVPTAASSPVPGPAAPAASDEPAVDPAAEALLKQAVASQTAEIAQRGGNMAVSQARQHAPVDGERPFNGGAS